MTTVTCAYVRGTTRQDDGAYLCSGVIREVECGVDRVLGMGRVARGPADTLAPGLARTPPPPAICAQSKAENAKAAELAIASERLKNWTEVELKALKKGLAQFPAGARNRWESIANVVGTRDAEEVTALVKTCPGLLAGKPEDAYSKFLSDRKAPKGEAVNVVGSKGSSNAPAWTPAATSALVKAMGAFPASKYDGTERWERVAAAVPGEHTPAQCQRKAVELAKAVAAKKKAAAEAGPA